MEEGGPPLQQKHFDVVVLGGGPCGLRAAEEAAGWGKSVALVDPSEQLTGSPTGGFSQCLRAAALRGASSWREVSSAFEQASANLVREAARGLERFKVRTIKAKGVLVDEGRVQVSPGNTELRADAIVIATGATPNRFPPVDFRLAGVYDSHSIAQLDRMPKRVVVQGAGLGGIEFALAFARLGAHVTVIDVNTNFMQRLDHSLQEAVKEALVKLKVELVMGVKFERVISEPSSSPEHPALRIDAGDRTFGCDTLIAACGRRANSSGLGLESLASKGMKLKPDGKIEVDALGWTGVGKVYAVGDVAAGSSGLATMGQYQAVRAVNALLSNVPSTETTASVKSSVIWTIPEVAWAGMTEDQARRAGCSYGVSVAHFQHTTKGCVTGEGGFLKLIFERDTGKTLGVHLFGEGSSELVNYGAEAVNLGTVIGTMSLFVFPAVTYHDVYSMAAGEGKAYLQRLRGEKQGLAEPTTATLANATHSHGLSSFFHKHGAGTKASAVETRKPSQSEASCCFHATVLGAGPAGLKAATEIAARGKKVALIDPQALGAVHGVPTGAHSKVLRTAVLEGRKTWAEVQDIMSRAVANAVSQASRLITSCGTQLEVMRGHGQLVNEHTVAFIDVASGSQILLQTEAIVIATGSTSNRPPPADFSLPGVFDTDTIWGIDFIPRKLIIQGAGLIGVEYGLIFSKLGSEVIISNANSEFLPNFDLILNGTVRKELEANSVQLCTDCPITSLCAARGSTAQNPHLTVELGGTQLECDAFLSACGRRGNLHHLNLEALAPKGLKVSEGLVKVDEQGFTGCAQIYAAGDCATGSMGLATMGQTQAMRAAQALFSSPSEARSSIEHKPAVIWTVPEVAWAGLTREQLWREARDFSFVKLAFQQTLKGCITMEEGFLELLFDRKSGQILGLHLFGEGSCELVQFGGTVVNAGMTVAELSRAVFPTNTYHQLYQQAAVEAELTFRAAQYSL